MYPSLIHSAFINKRTYIISMCIHLCPTMYNHLFYSSTSDQAPFFLYPFKNKHPIQIATLQKKKQKKKHRGTKNSTFLPPKNGLVPKTHAFINKYIMYVAICRLFPFIFPVSIVVAMCVKFFDQFSVIAALTDRSPSASPCSISTTLIPPYLAMPSSPTTSSSFLAITLPWQPALLALVFPHYHNPS